MLTPVRLLEIEVEQAAAVGGALQEIEGSEPVSLRPLPWPFEHFLTIASDCDSPNYEGFVDIGRIVRETYGLPIADSFFPEWFHDRATRGAPTATGALPIDDYVAANATWIRHYHLGWTDTVHGWLTRYTQKVADDFELDVDLPGGGLLHDLNYKVLHRTAYRLERRGHRLRAGRVWHEPLLQLPEGWLDKCPPRYLYFGYRQPIAGSIVDLEILDGERLLTAVRIDEHAPGAHVGWNDYVLDLRPAAGHAVDVLRRLRFRFRAVSSRCLFQVRDLALLSSIGTEMRSQAATLAALNLRGTVFTSHGSGYDLGRRVEGNAAAADPRRPAENPANPVAALALLRAHGVEFINTVSNTSSERLRHIRDLVFPSLLNSGDVVYDFHRYTHVPRTPAGEPDSTPYVVAGVLQNSSYAMFVGLQIDGALADCAAAAPGSGGIIYTHMLARALDDPRRGRRGVEEILDPAGHAALRALADRYYDFAGTGAAGRVLVAPTAVMLRLSQVAREIERHARYDAARNEVHIASWRDPVTGQIVPCPGQSGRQLRALTFHVVDATTARVFLDGTEIAALVRNPADGSGRESVTIADCSAPKVLLGSVPIGARPALPVAVEGLITGAAEGGGTLLTLTGAEGTLAISYANAVLANRQALAWTLERSAPGVRYRWRFECDDGAVLDASEFAGTDAADVLALAPWPGPEPRTVVAPFYRMPARGPDGRRRPPVGRLRRVVLHLQGEPGQSLTLRALHLLRDDETPFDTAGVLVGGRLTGVLQLTAVRLEHAGVRYRTEMTACGHYFFRTRFPRGAIVHVTGIDPDGNEVEPLDGAVHEILANTPDIDFHG